MDSSVPFIFYFNNKPMIYTVESYKQKVLEKVYDVYEIFKNFFGENHVDLQDIPDVTHLLPSRVPYDNLPSEDISDGVIASIKRRHSTDRYHIYVWWPRVTITNEHDKSIDIQDLYAQITIDINGCIPYENRGFLLNRSTYSSTQFSSRYMHSHIPSISSDHLSHFMTPCLGRGPINNTIMDLKNSYDEMVWMLFCEELSRYVTVESLAGVPYRKLEEVGASTLLTPYNRGYCKSDYHYIPRFNTLPNLTEMMKNFTKYYLQHGHLNLSFKDGEFVPGMPYFNFIVDISNSFIEWFNTESGEEGNTKYKLIDKGILRSAIVNNQKFYKNETLISPSDLALEGTLLFSFKGREIRLHIEQDVSQDERFEVIILDHNLAMYILYSIIEIINYRYTNEYYNREGSPTAATYQTVLYL